MLTSLVVEQFRGIDHIELRPKRITILSGRNNSGKTTILEAIFLHLGAASPALSLLLNAMRGLPDKYTDPLYTWGWFFPNSNTTREPMIKSTDSDEVRRTVSLRVHAGQQVLIAPSTSPGDINGRSQGLLSTEPASGRELLLDYSDSSGKQFVSVAKMTPKGVAMESPQPTVFAQSMIIFPLIPTSEDDAKRYSKLEEDNRHDEVLRVLQIIEPGLRRLAVSVSDNGTLIRCDLGLGRLIPLGMAGGGMCRLFDFVVSILSSPGGVVLIDEVDTGFHHSVMKDVWTAIVDVAARTNVQIIATTHSSGCLRAAHAALSERLQYEGVYYRIERDGTSTRAVEFDTETLGTAIESDWEVR